MFALEEKLRAVELVRDGMSYREAARACGASVGAVWKWREAMDGDAEALYALVGGRRAAGKDGAMDLADLPDDPDELKRIILDQRFELDLTKSVVDMLKKDPGVDPRMLSNREKTILVDALSRTQTYSLGYLLRSLRLARATFYYHRKRRSEDPEAALRARVVGICATEPSYGYRRVKAALASDAQEPLRASEKRIRRIMRGEGIQPPRRRRRSRYSSYSPRKDSSVLPNVPLRADGTHDFSAEAPNVLWLTDVTEFRLPSGRRVYLSPVLDCFDGALAGWEISTSERSEDLTDPSLKAACAGLREGEHPTAHTDRGGHYHAESWKAICGEHGIARSMSRKGCSPDNARMEGFFGRLKMEFFDTRDWKGVGTEAFIAELDSWLVHYNETRPKLSLGWMSPMQYRRSLGQAA